ncbi:hypothetical protein MSG28_001355 [Choristoneura fumiferana]|uniref:Uncharacterized protein n=1 Tax=Choristoneura fumiferana TaxID=7141 RepID=A0ACC0KUY9_CHOFU|nr:hypothetical protein MSG28_001355 [Choristoneura fumiferana]
MHSFGYMLGLLIVGPLSDRCGRKALLVVTAVLGAICGLTRSFITNYWLYISVEFLEALIGDPCSPAYMLDESPRWLLIKGRKDAAVSILESAANTNKIKLDAEELDNIYYEEEKGASFGKVLVDTFKSKTMLKRFFVCSVWWIASTFVNHGLTINSVALQGNKYINYALTSIIDVPGHVIVTLILLKFKRKVPLLAYWSGLPATVFGLVSLTAGLLTLLVPDTADNSLPDTVFQAEILEQPLEIGKNQLGNRKESSKL